MEGRSERAYQLAWELVGLKPDLVVAVGGNVRVVKQITRTLPIPIVKVGTLDPEGWLVDTLAHPGGNLTGLAYTAGLELFGKQLQLLKEAAPKASRVTVLTYGGLPSYQGELNSAARALGLTLQSRELWAPETLAGDFAKMITAGVDALLGEPSPVFFAYRQQISALALQHRLPSMFAYRGLTEAGSLMSYGPNEPALYRRLGSYVDKIFKGANLGHLPVEQPDKFELLINLKTAKALGLTIPQSLLSVADEVIE
jgi:putative ABC transport system substrate-binding protein